MKSIEMTQSGYEGIPTDKDALTLEDVKEWADTRDAELIPQAIATIKGLWGTATVEEVTPSVETVSVAEAGTEDVFVTLSPDYIAGKTVTWSSSADAYATVEADTDDSTKATITGVAVGSATITASVDGVSATIAVTVTAA